MSSFILKIIAIISMLFDHAGDIYSGGALTWANLIGRLAFPIFAFQATIGYTHTKNIYAYIKRLLIFAVISQIPFNLFQYTLNFSFTLNIFFTLALGLSAIFFYDKNDNKKIGLLLAGVCIALGEFLKVDYGYWGVLIIFVFYLCRNSKLLLSFGTIGLTAVKYLPLYISTQNIWTLYLGFSFILSLIPILLYNGKKGYKMKYLFYIFYPVHLIILSIIGLI